MFPGTVKHPLGEKDRNVLVLFRQTFSFCEGVLCFLREKNVMQVTIFQIFCTGCQIQQNWIALKVN